LQRRYKAIRVEADSYAQELSRYIHLNPVRAGMAEKPHEYRWTSYQGYINIKNKPESLYADFILGLFNRKLAVARKQNLLFVESMTGLKIESPKITSLPQQYWVKLSL